MAILPSVFIPEETDENPFAPIDAGWVLAEISKWPAKNEIKAFKNADELPALRGDSDDPLED